MDAALRVIRYLKRQPDQGILMSSCSDELVTAYCDADWASCPLTRKSVTGYLIKVGNSLVSWKAKKQTTMSRSSAEATSSSSGAEATSSTRSPSFATELRVL